MSQIEHPDITNVRLTGYPRGVKDVPSTEPIDSERFKRDFYGDTVDMKNDHYVVIPMGYLLLHANLQRYLEERGYEFNYYMSV